jgi:hypothetical protein
MVPGITDTECRLKQLRYPELHAEAARQRLAATACAQEVRGGIAETLQSRLASLMKRSRHFLYRFAYSKGAWSLAIVPRVRCAR